MELTLDERPDGSATFSVRTPTWEVYQDSTAWRILTHDPALPARSGRSAPFATAHEARRVAAGLAAHWLATQRA